MITRLNSRFNSTALIILSLSSLTLGSSVNAEKPKQTSSTLAQLVPKGWKLLESSQGDLNKDGLSDVAIIVEKLKSDIVVKADDGKAIHNHPRQLMVFFKSTKGYQLIASNKTIPVAETQNSCIEDFLANTESPIEIKNGVLTAHFSYFLSCGGWESPQHTFRFRWQQNQFKLIGFDYFSYARNTGEQTASSYNFSTLKVKKTTGANMFEGGKAKSTWSKFKAPQKLSLNNINFDDFHTQFNY